MEQYDEHEQGERVRAWLRNNGSSIIGGIALGLGALFGWQWWQDRGVAQRHEAATEYHAYLAALDAGEADKAAAHLQVLREQFGTLPYASLGALRQAAALAAKGDHDAAVAALEQVAGDGTDPTLAALARLRAARVLLDAGRAEDALARLDAEVESAFPAVAAELRGDAELALGQREQARAAYEKALVAMDQGAPARAIVELKLTDAGGTPAEPEA